jgi:hypothetical protein
VGSERDVMLDVSLVSDCWAWGSYIVIHQIHERDLKSAREPPEAKLRGLT